MCVDVSRISYVRHQDLSPQSPSSAACRSLVADSYTTIDIRVVRREKVGGIYDIYNLYISEWVSTKVAEWTA